MDLSYLNVMDILFSELFVSIMRSKCFFYLMYAGVFVLVVGEVPISLFGILAKPMAFFDFDRAALR